MRAAPQSMLPSRSSAWPTRSRSSDARSPSPPVAPAKSPASRSSQMPTAAAFTCSNRPASGSKALTIGWIAATTPVRSPPKSVTRATVNPAIAAATRPTGVASKPSAPASAPATESTVDMPLAIMPRNTSNGPAAATPAAMPTAHFCVVSSSSENQVARLSALSPSGSSVSANASSAGPMASPIFWPKTVNFTCACCSMKPRRLTPCDWASNALSVAPAALVSFSSFAVYWSASGPESASASVCPSMLPMNDCNGTPACSATDVIVFTVSMKPSCSIIASPDV